MMNTTIFRMLTGLFTILFLSLPLNGYAQDGKETVPAKLFSKEELAQMLAPIALHPDVLLTQILMASTYPVEVVEADRWVKNNPRLRGDSLSEALLDKEWDPSVKALAHFPSILALLSERVTETADLGYAFLAQKDEVMEIIQELRTQAYREGNLVSTPEQRVVVKDNSTIIIEPANPRVMYEPDYDPNYVYGSWGYPDYPPYYWGVDGPILGATIFFRPVHFVSFAVVSWSHFDWHRHHIVIHDNVPKFFRHHDLRAKHGFRHPFLGHGEKVLHRDHAIVRGFDSDVVGPPHPRRLESPVSVRRQGAIIDRRDRAGSRIEREVTVERRIAPARTLRQGTDDGGPVAMERVERQRRSGESIDRNREVRPRIERQGEIRPRVEQEQALWTRIERQRMVLPRSGREGIARPRIDSSGRGGGDDRVLRNSGSGDRRRDSVFKAFRGGGEERGPWGRGQSNLRGSRGNDSDRDRSGFFNGRGRGEEDKDKRLDRRGRSGRR